MNERQVDRWLPYGLVAVLVLLSALTQPACAGTSEDSAIEEFKERIAINEPARGKKLFIAYPKSGGKVWAPSTFVIGAVSPGAEVLVDGVPARVNNQGYFAHVVKLKGGSNEIIVSLADKSASEQITITRPMPKPAAPLGVDKLRIKADSIEPKQDHGVTPGDLVVFKVRATPGGTVAVRMGDQKITLSPALAVNKAKKQKGGKLPPGGNSEQVAPNVNFGLAVAYGKVFQSFPATSQDLYVGFYKVQPSDRFNHAPLKFTLSKDGKSISALAPGTVSVVTQPYMAQTVKDDTVVRAQPGKARLTPLPKGVRLTVDGWQGKDLRCQYTGAKHVWVTTDDIAYERGTPYATSPPPRSYVKALNIARDRYGDALVIPLNQRLPFEIEQKLSPNSLTLTIYGAIADTDFASQSYKQAFEQGTPPGQATGAESESPKSGETGLRGGLIDGVTWKQIQDDVYQVKVSLRGDKQWGYFPSFYGSNLILHVKHPPNLTASPGRLSGLTICVDPGHGGAQPGATGCSGVLEAQVNFEISMKLKARLEQEGARVIMSRTDDTDIDLYDRIEIARRAGADILLSVHNNSLPDGRDPWKEHGTSTYWYHPQSRQLAKSIDDALVKKLGWPDIGARYQNLALTRAHTMLAVLAEIGFMINPDEYAKLLQPEIQDKAAQGLVEGIANYLGANRN